MRVSRGTKASRLNRRGATAVELAMISPVFIALVMGQIETSRLRTQGARPVAAEWCELLEDVMARVGVVRPGEVLGLIGDSVTQPLLQNLATVAPGPARSILTSSITNVQSHQGTAGALFVVGLVLALWSASGYIAAFMRAAPSARASSPPPRRSPS